MNGWTSTGIAYVQAALSRETILEACQAIEGQDDATAHDKIMSAIRQLQTAAGMLR
ncbi:MAG: hypothetical protein K0S37_3660 [Microbacterium sp.]|jgi:hypothetical protein|nr:hypothetical protein [Microbacterium sp.]